MDKYIKCGPYVLTSVLQDLSYGRLFRAVRAQGFAFLEHLIVLLPNEAASSAGMEGLLDDQRAWFDTFEGLNPRRVVPLSFFLADEALNIQMPHFRGRSLAEILRKNTDEQVVQMEHVFTFAQDLANIVADVHSVGGAHGALNLDGIWLDKDGYLRLVDGPLGRILCQAGFQKEVLGPLAGVKTHFGVDFANDQESFGLILYHLITGEWPNQSSLDTDVMSLEMRTKSDWENLGEDSVQMVPELLKKIILHSIRAEYPHAEALRTDVLTAYQAADAEYAPTTFGAAFLLRNMFLSEMQEEQAAIELEKSYEFVEAIGEPKVVDRIVFQEDIKKKRRIIALAAVVVSLALGWGGFALVKANQTRALQEKIKVETEGLVAKLHADQEKWEKDQARWATLIANARTQGERDELIAQAEAARREHDAQQAAIKAQIQALQDRQKALGGKVSALAEPATPKFPAQMAPATAPQAVPDPQRPATALAQSQASQQASPVQEHKDRARPNPEAVPFAPSAKTPMGAAETTPASIPEPVYLTGATRVEVLKKPDSSGGSVTTTTEAAPAVSVKDQATANQFRRLVMPQLDASALRAFQGQTVRLRVLIDPFGKVKTASVDDCPKALASDFKAAAMKTEFNPLMENGRAKQGWVSLAFKVTGSGVSLDGR